MAIGIRNANKVDSNDHCNNSANERNDGNNGKIDQKFCKFCHKTCNTHKIHIMYHDSCMKQVKLRIKH